MSATGATSSTPNSGNDGGEGSSPVDADNGTYECNICLETANDAVVSMCGHLFW